MCVRIYSDIRKILNSEKQLDHRFPIWDCGLIIYSKISLTHQLRRTTTSYADHFSWVPNDRSFNTIVMIY